MFSKYTYTAEEKKVHTPGKTLKVLPTNQQLRVNPSPKRRTRSVRDKQKMGGKYINQQSVLFSFLTLRVEGVRLNCLFSLHRTSVNKTGGKCGRGELPGQTSQNCNFFQTSSITSCNSCKQITGHPLQTKS
jgi:hypothetical protein